jgi:hypothetical protein
LAEPPESQALLVIIGPNWLRKTGAAGRTNLDDPDDFIRLEIENAITRKIPLIPVLVDNAEMPGENELPPSLRPLRRRHFVRVNHENYTPVVERLVSQLSNLLQVAQPTGPQPWPTAPQAKGPRSTEAQSKETQSKETQVKGPRSTETQVRGPQAKGSPPTKGQLALALGILAVSFVIFWYYTNHSSLLSWGVLLVGSTVALAVWKAE